MTIVLTVRDLWRDALADARALLPLALPVAAAFVMLPGVVIDLYGPPLAVATRTVEVPVAAPPAPAIARVANTATTPTKDRRRGQVSPPSLDLTPRVVVVDVFVPTLIGLIAQLAIIRLALDRRRGVARSVGEALLIAMRAWPFAVVALVLGAVPVGFGIVALVVPGLYLAGRLAPAPALVVDGHGPLAALRRAWEMTEGNGWRVIGLTLLLLGWFVLISLATGAVAGGLAALLGAVGAGAVAPFVTSSTGGLVAALFTVANAAAVATVYRRLG